LTRKIGLGVLALAFFFCSALIAVWLAGGWSLGPARDYEECIATGSAMASVADAPRANQCESQFAGRRKPGGGYTFFDFMQNRQFDIAGPNPSPEEIKQIDREYMNFLDARRRDATDVALANQQREQLRSAFETSQEASVGPPLVITPKMVPGSTAKSVSDRSRAEHCNDGSLSCNWAKLSANVGALLGPSSKIKR
jgi:hypothetical protein